MIPPDDDPLATDRNLAARRQAAEDLSPAAARKF